MGKEIVQNAGGGPLLFDPSDFDGLAEEMARNAYKSLCPGCGGPVAQSGKGRKKIFCSDACRKRYWNRQRTVKKNGGRSNEERDDDR